MEAGLQEMGGGGERADGWLAGLSGESAEDSSQLVLQIGGPIWIMEWTREEENSWVSNRL